MKKNFLISSHLLIFQQYNKKKAAFQRPFAIIVFYILFQRESDVFRYHFFQVYWG